MRHTFEKDVHGAAEYLMVCLQHAHDSNDKDNMAWSYLEATGDTQYTGETLKKAAKTILGVKDE